MSNYKQILEKTSKEIEEILLSECNATKIPTEDYGWENSRYISDVFRIAHIERYSEKNLEVLHFTCFPNVDCQEPIFGFDTITTDTKPLASFLDWSPIDNLKTFGICEYQFEQPYKLPKWAELIFSKNAIAIVPRETELEIVCDIAKKCLIEYIELLKKYKPQNDRVGYIVAKQNFYCEQQQKNERTFNVLKSKLGFERAKIFMETILFPKIHVS